MQTETEKTYLRARVQNASSAGLVIILLDMLIADLERAKAAMAEGSVEKRAAELKHAFVVLQQLDDSLDRENGGEAAQTFSSFYSAIRAKVALIRLRLLVSSLAFRMDSFMASFTLLSPRISFNAFNN